jgi:myo-inositol 2-dehydrogenase/D-chiro-inositol 1-dehydrogenase
MVLGIGVIGAGVMGGDHARVLAGSVRGAEVRAVADADTARAGAVAKAAGASRTHTDALALIADPAIDAVLIASPDDTHVPYTLACIAAGKPVLCEKPLAPDAEGCLAVMAAEQNAGRRLVQVGFMRRFDPGYTAMRRQREAGGLGSPVMLHCAHRNAEAPPWFTSEMVITNSAVHEIDIVRWLLDDEYASVTAFMRAAHGKPPPSDRQFLVFETRRGTVVDVELYMNARYGYDVTAELVCESGTVSLAQHAPVETRSSLAQSRAYAPDWRAHFADAYRIQAQAWVDGIRSGEPTGASAYDGYVATAVAGICLRAAETGARTPVELMERPAFYA